MGWLELILGATGEWLRWRHVPEMKRRQAEAAMAAPPAPDRQKSDFQQIKQLSTEPAIQSPVVRFVLRELHGLLCLAGLFIVLAIAVVIAAYVVGSN